MSTAVLSFACRLCFSPSIFQGMFHRRMLRKVLVHTTNAACMPGMHGMPERESDVSVMRGGGDESRRPLRTLYLYCVTKIY